MKFGRVVVVRDGGPGSVLRVSQQLQAVLEIRYQQVFAPTSRLRVPSARHTQMDTPVAARATKTERRRPVFKAGASCSMHAPPTLARGTTGKAVLALEVRSRTLP